MDEQELNDRVARLERAAAAMHERNKRVEADKAWERSAARIILICVITYIVAVIALWSFNVSNFLLSGLIPTIGFFLSVQSLPLVKRWWVKNRIKNNE